MPDFEAKARALLNNGYGDGEIKVLADAFRAMYEAGRRDGRDEYVIMYGDPTAAKPYGVLDMSHLPGRRVL